MHRFVGEIAALATAVCWSISAVAFQSASVRIGSMVVNWLRLVLGLGFLSVTGLLTRGRLIPDAPLESWAWLGLSGLVGFVVGDLALFRAFVMIGARLSMLVMCLAPPLTALLGFVFLGERLSLSQGIGMALTVGGVAWTVTEGTPGRPDPTIEPSGTARKRMTGVLLAGIGALGQAGGLLLSKMGMAGVQDPFAATQMRVLAGIGGFTALFCAMRWWGEVGRARRDGRALVATATGSFFGPFLGVSLSLLAVHRTQAGVAAALMSLVPIVLIPMSVLVFRERPSTRSVLGTLLAVGGVVVLFR